MYKIISNNLFLVLICCTSLCFSQTWPGGINIINQSDLDTLTHFEHIGGSLIIGDNSSFPKICDIHDLSAFDKLKSIGGNLIITNTDSLKILNGLDSLTSIGGLQININNNKSLESLESLRNIRAPRNNPFGDATQMTVYNNPKLSRLPVFHRLDTLGGLLQFEHNPLLSSLGLDSLRYVGKTISIRDNQLENLHFFRNLQRTEGLYIVDEPMLTSLKGIEAIQFEHHNPSFTIKNCPNIIDFSACKNWKTARLNVNVIDNSSLENISDLQIDNLGRFLIYNNPKLEEVILPTLDSASIDIRNCANLQTIDLSSFYYPSALSSFICIACPRIKTINLPLYGIDPSDSLLYSTVWIKNCDSLQSIFIPNAIFGGGTVDSCFLLNTLESPAMEKGGFSISNCPKLELLRLDNLREGKFELWNSGPPKLEGFDKFVKATSFVFIGSQAQADSVNTFQNLRECEYISIGDHSNIRYWRPMLALDTIHRSLGMDTYNAPALIELPNLKTIERQAFYYAQTNQKDLRLSMPKLDYVKDIWVSDSDSLLSIDPLSNIQLIGESATIKNNPLLSDCSAICTILSHGQTDPSVFQLDGNAEECLNLMAVETYCDTLSMVSITEFDDTSDIQSLVLRFAPNPASVFENASCNFQWPASEDTGMLTVANINGLVKYQKKISYPQNSIEFSCKGWDKGVYIISIKSNKYFAVGQLIVQ